MCLCYGIFGNSGTIAEITGNTASVEFNRPPQYKNIKSAVMGDASTIYCVERADKYGWTLDVNKGDNARYIYIDFEDEFLSEINDGTAVDIEVEYFDADNAMFTLSYDAQEDASRDAEIIYLGISNTWKTHTFSLNDAYFGGRLNGHDLRIGIHSDDMGKAKQSVIISKVTVTKYQAKNPVSIKTTSEETGNIFGNGEKIKFKNTYKSFRDEDTELLAEYRAVKKNGDVVWSKNDTITVKARETLEVTIELEITEYELYYLETVIQNDSLNINTENKVPFSFVNTDPNGIKNERFGTNVHHLFGRDPYKENKAILKANISSIREGVYWEHFEDLQGVYSFEGDVEERIFDAARKAGLKSAYQ